MTISEEELLELESKDETELRELVLEARENLLDLGAELGTVQEKLEKTEAARLKMIDNLVMIAAEIGAPAPASYERVIARVRALRLLEKAAGSAALVDGMTGLMLALGQCRDAAVAPVPTPPVSSEIGTGDASPSEDAEK
jgi:hypothetical protein